MVPLSITLLTLDFFNIEYLRNDTRYSHSYYRTSLGSHMQSIEWWHFQWPWWILKLTQFSRSGHFWSRISHGHTIDSTLIGKQVCQHQLSFLCFVLLLIYPLLFLYSGSPSCHPTNSVKEVTTIWRYMNSNFIIIVIIITEGITCNSYDSTLTWNNVQLRVTEVVRMKYAYLGCQCKWMSRHNVTPTSTNTSSHSVTYVHIYISYKYAPNVARSG